MLIDCHDDAFRREPKFPRRSVQDPLVGLMRHEPVDVGGLVSGLLSKCRRSLR